MKNNKKQWVLTIPKSQNRILSLSDKHDISVFFQPLVDEFKSKCIVENPDPNCNSLIDIYTLYCFSWDVQKTISR